MQFALPFIGLVIKIPEMIIFGMVSECLSYVHYALGEEVVIWVVSISCGTFHAVLKSPPQHPKPNFREPPQDDLCTSLLCAYGNWCSFPLNVLGPIERILVATHYYYYKAGKYFTHHSQGLDNCLQQGFSNFAIPLRT